MSAEENWGEKIEISIYVEGKASAQAVIKATEAAAEVLKEDGAVIDFGGAAHYPIKQRPISQEG